MGRCNSAVTSDWAKSLRLAGELEGELTKDLDRSKDRSQPSVPVDYESRSVPGNHIGSL